MKRAVLKRALLVPLTTYSHEEYTPGIIGIGTFLDLPPVYPMCSLNFAIPAVRMTESLQNRAIKALNDAKTAIEAHMTSVELSA